MERTITCGQHLCKTAMIDDSVFDDVSMTKVSFNNVNLTDAKFRNINMSSTDFFGIEFRNAKFKAVGLDNVDISDCTLEGTRINGILVTELLDAYEKQQTSRASPTQDPLAQPKPQQNEHITRCLELDGLGGPNGPLDRLPRAAAQDTTFAGGYRPN